MYICKYAFHVNKKAFSQPTKSTFLRRRPCYCGIYPCFWRYLSHHKQKFDIILLMFNFDYYFQSRHCKLWHTCEGIKANKEISAADSLEPRFQYRQQLFLSQFIIQWTSAMGCGWQTDRQTYSQQNTEIAMD